MGPNNKPAFDYLRAKGLTDAQAAGVVGNLEQESLVNPRQGQTGGGPGRGIAQWETPGRWDQLTLWARQQNRDPFDLELQLDFLWKELQTYPYLGLSELRNAGSVEQATQIFQDKFERPRVGNLPRRIALAKATLQAFGSTPIEEDHALLRAFLLVAVPTGLFVWGYHAMKKRGMLRPKRA